MRPLQKAGFYQGIYRLKDSLLIRRTDGYTIKLGDRGTNGFGSQHFLADKDRYIGNFYGKQRFSDAGIEYEAVWDGEKSVAIILKNTK
jgi:hypothetical protein